MDKVKKINNWFRSNWFFAIVIFLLILLFGSAQFLNSVKTIKSLFDNHKKDSTEKNNSPLKVNSNAKNYETIIKEMLTKSIVDTMKFKRKYDITDLVKKLLIDTNGRGPDWDFESNNEAINWITMGREENDSNDYPFTRKGYLIITDNNKPIYQVLRNRIEDGVWEIVLCGQNHSIHCIMLNAVYTGPYIDPFIVEKFIVPKFFITKIQSKKDTTDLPSNMDYSFILKSANKKNQLINEKTFCGSDGCSVSLEFVYH